MWNLGSHCSFSNGTIKEHTAVSNTGALRKSWNARWHLCHFMVNKCHLLNSSREAKSEIRKILKQPSVPLFSHIYTVVALHSGDPWMCNSAITFHDPWALVAPFSTQPWSLGCDSEGSISMTQRPCIFSTCPGGFEMVNLLSFWSLISVEMRLPAETKCMSSLSFPCPHFTLYAGLYLQLLHSSHLPVCKCLKKEIKTGVQSKSLWGKDAEQNTAVSTPR